MPAVAMFFGIVISMYHRDHGRPHFHAVYQGHEAVFDIESGEIIEGEFPRGAAQIVRDWLERRRGELHENWVRARARQPLLRVPGADND